VKVTAVRFLGAAAAPGEGPPCGPPEIAIAGRSNAGKSSVINRLVGRRGLARTSSTPGRTRQINFFVVNERFRLVDLPGYGYAVGPAAERLAWQPLVESYLRERPALRGLAVVLDVRRDLEPDDAQLFEYLAAHDLPAVVVATKLDKLGHAAARARLARLSESLRGRAAIATQARTMDLIGFSARTGEGRDALWRIFRGWLDVAPRGSGVPGDPRHARRRARVES
jgi:GTP-binding protein